MQEIFEILNNARKASQIALDQQGRHPYPVMGIVTNNNDPEGKRRIKVALPSSPQVESDWIRRLLVSPFIDPPLPEVGQTVLCLWAEGLETLGFYLQLMNNTNPARDKDDPIKDLSMEVPGARTSSVKQDDKLIVGGDTTTEVGGSINDSAQKDITFSSGGDFATSAERDILMSCLNALILHAETYLKLQAGPTNYIELGADGSSKVSGTWTINLSGATLNFVNASSITINGKQVATVGAVDSDGDVITQKGW